MLDWKKEGWDYAAIGKLDYNQVKAPYIRLNRWQEGKQGDCVFVYDFRFTQPNKNYMKPEVLHTLEHFFEVGFRSYMEDRFINVAPMGCQTGFYLILLNEHSAFNIISTIRQILEDILKSDEVPFNNTNDCGQALYHDLIGSKEIARILLLEKHNWLEVFC